LQARRERAGLEGQAAANQDAKIRIPVSNLDQQITVSEQTEIDDRQIEMAILRQSRERFVRACHGIDVVAHAIQIQVHETKQGFFVVDQQNGGARVGHFAIADRGWLPAWSQSYHNAPIPMAMNRTLPVDKTEVQANCQELLASLLAQLVSDFDAQPEISARSLRRLAEYAPEMFFAAGLSLLATVEESRGSEYLAILLSKAPNLLDRVTDAEAHSVEQATAIARRLHKVSPEITYGLTRRVPREDRPLKPDALCCSRALRAVEILNDLQDPVAIPLLRQLVRSSDVAVSSKAALALGRGLHNVDWARDVMRETTDARIRANVLEALWGEQSDGARALFQEYSRDQSNRVAGNAVVGMYLLKAPEAAELLEGLARAASVEYRKTAAWVIGRLADLMFLPLLEALIDDPHPEVRSLALDAKVKVPAAVEAGPVESAEATPLEPSVPKPVEPKDEGFGFHLWVEGSRIGG
jgi:HEAT repeat protein